MLEDIVGSWNLFRPILESYAGIYYPITLSSHTKSMSMTGSRWWMTQRTPYNFFKNPMALVADPHFGDTASSFFMSGLCAAVSVLSVASLSRQ